ncbi:Two component system histidine kinase ArlS [Staphylococcus aureus]|uniref:Two component system histidine kinase ArlS n=1 Tax=Staphylococcus aureus TaxID=1280 RepID=A0A2X2LZB2_STAAU|nr:Two component system histidine kinase ArlS [Staphylococcus aureus]
MNTGILTAVIKKRYKGILNYLIIKEPITTQDFKGYSLLIHSLENYDNIVKSLYIIAARIWSDCNNYNCHN